MLRFFYKHLNNKKGFTLMELIIVIAIIGILALIAVPRLTGFTERAKERADEATAKSIENALRILEADGKVNLNDLHGKTILGGTNKLTDPLLGELKKLIELEKPQTGDYWLITVNGGTVRVEAKSNPAN